MSVKINYAKSDDTKGPKEKVEPALDGPDKVSVPPGAASEAAWLEEETKSGKASSTPPSWFKTAEYKYVTVEGLPRCHYMLLGQTESGKSNILKALIHYKVMVSKEYDYVVLWGSNADRGDYEYIPKELRYRHCHIPTIKQWWRYQEDQMKLAKETGVKPKKCLHVFDDVAGVNFHSKKQDDEGMKFWDDYMSRCRHDNIHLIISIQFINSIPPFMRTNVKTIILTSANRETTDAIFPLTKAIGKPTFDDFIDSTDYGKAALIDVNHGAKLRFAYLKTPNMDDEHFDISKNGSDVFAELEEEEEEPGIVSQILGVFDF